MKQHNFWAGRIL